ncbi:MAG TPA: PEP-CTERM sorting domain-containing protein [Pirellulales bacterium]|nr:PEP-CTERM sorting domain-containing protein [Pirellulales bacterium]
MTRPLICLTVFAAALVCVGPVAFGQVNISVKMNDIQANIADGDPFPDNLFDLSGPNPFSGTTTGGGNAMLAAVWEQTINVTSSGNETVGTIQGPPALAGQLQQQIQVTEQNSQMLYYEPFDPGDGNFVTSGDPILFSSFNMAGGQPMVLNLVDSDNNGGNGFTPYINDLFPQIPLPNGTEIAVWEGAPIQVEIVALTLTGVEPIAINTMVPFEFYADDGTNQLDNAFGVFEDDWFLPLGPNVQLDLDGVPGGPLGPSPFLMDWPNLPQTRSKGHPGGFVNVVIGSPPPGPAGIFHPTAGVPEPSTAVLSMLALAGFAMSGWRRRRRA